MLATGLPPLSVSCNAICTAIDDLALVSLNLHPISFNVSRNTAVASSNSSRNRAESRAEAPMISSRYTYRSKAAVLLTASRGPASIFI